MYDCSRISNPDISLDSNHSLNPYRSTSVFRAQYTPDKSGIYVPQCVNFSSINAGSPTIFSSSPSELICTLFGSDDDTFDVVFAYSSEKYLTVTWRVRDEWLYVVRGSMKSVSSNDTAARYCSNAGRSSLPSTVYFDKDVSAPTSDWQYTYYPRFSSPAENAGNTVGAVLIVLAFASVMINMFMGLRRRR